MKKFITAILICILSVISIFAFTACDNETKKGNEGGSGNNTEQSGNNNNGESGDPEEGGSKEVRTTVTEEEWINALKKITIDDITDTSFLNVTLNTYYYEPYTDHYEEMKGIFTLDIINKIIYQSSTVFNSKEPDKFEKFEMYRWIDSDETYYEYANYKGDVEMGASNDEYYINFFKAIAVNYLNSLVAYKSYYENITEDFDKFTYDEEKGEYRGSTTNVSAGGETDVFYFVFADGKLVKSGLDFIYNGEHNRSWKEEYTYGVSVTIPDEILNLDFGIGD